MTGSLLFVAPVRRQAPEVDVSNIDELSHMIEYIIVLINDLFSTLIYTKYKIPYIIQLNYINLFLERIDIFALLDE